MESISQLMMYCGECDYDFRSENVDEVCPKCGEKASGPEIDETQIESLIRVIQENDDESDYYKSLHRLWWFDHTKETLQACWYALKQIDSNDSKISNFIKMIEDDFTNALSNAEREEEESKMISAWEKQNDY